VDIQATIAHEPMKTYSQEEFVFVCDALWDIVVGVSVQRDFIAQSGSIATRMLNACETTTSDEERYREKFGGFNTIYNSKQPEAGVDDLGVVRVPRNKTRSSNEIGLYTFPTNTNQVGMRRQNETNGLDIATSSQEEQTGSQGRGVRARSIELAFPQQWRCLTGNDPTSGLWESL
jgi:hypothetical protein